MATGLNYAGNVIGTCFGKYAGGGSRAFRTDSGGAFIKTEDDLGLPAGIKGGYSFATGVNADGHVVGYWSGGADKAFWHDGSKGSKMINIHPVTFMTSKAFAVNIHDDVVGAAYALKFGPVSFGVTFDGHAVIWPHVDADHKVMTDLNDDLADKVKKDWILKAAFGISDDGDIVGRAYKKKTGKYHAFLLKGVGGEFFDLGALKEDVFDSSAAYALNACDAAVPEIDKVVGYTYADSKTYPGKAFHYGFVWTGDSGLTEIETLGPYAAKPDLLESFLQAINTKTEAVGAVSFAFHLSQSFEYEVLGPGPGLVGDSCIPNSHAVWYNGKDLKDLNKLIPGSPGWELNLANGISDKGWIAGSGFYKCSTAPALSSSKLSKAVLLIPASSSPTASASGEAKCPLSLPSGGYIFDNWNICGVKNGPTKDTTFTIDKDSLVTFVATYHWNDGKGALPKKGISLKDSAGVVYGPWPVTTSAGSGGKINVNWECHPGITLPAGTYTVIDPDPATWSQNDGSGNSGFARVAGSATKK
jgi:probable HAF family extracellular repeat protein